MTIPDPSSDRSTHRAVTESLPKNPDVPLSAEPREKAGTAHPNRIGPYPIQHELGRGGMGVVYLAEDPRLKRAVAIKVLSNRVERTALKRLEREAQLLASMNHPNIATIHSLESDGDLHFLTMEFIEGMSLAERLRHGPQTVDVALATGRKIARALEAAHKKGVIHRDLKPLNVMMTDDDDVKVLDFGLAKAISSESGRSRGPAYAEHPSGERGTRPDPMSEQADDEQSQRPDETTASWVVGTPGYMSPEQLRGESVDARTDVFAFGCVVYECFTGHRLFAGPTIHESIKATLETEPDLGRLPASTPERIRDLIARCLPKDTRDRLTTMTEARRTIEEVIETSKLERLIHLREEKDARVETSVVRHHNLPRQLTTFVGRQKELVSVTELLERHPLVSLTGVGGSGKTRLALEVGQRRLQDHPDGVWLVELASLTEPELVPQAVMSALELGEACGRTAIDIIVEYVQDKNVLLVLDNCEHMIDAVRNLSTTLLARCTQMHVLATSREALGVDGEAVHVVPTLTTPPAGEGSSLDEVLATEAGQLLMDRARAVDSNFTVTEGNVTAVAEICRRLDGIPLALELAAARTKALSVEDIATRLDQRFRILSRERATGLPRHRTLRGLIEWSYELLDGQEQAVLCRLSVFAGGWTLEAAEAVCADEEIEAWQVLDLFTRLVEKSLVERVDSLSEHGGPSRYRMLETVREYMAERLVQAGDADAARARHREHFLVLSEMADRYLGGPEQKAWLERLITEDENLALACVYAEGGEESECGLMLAGTLLRYWILRGQYSAGRAACKRALAHPGATAPTVGQARALDTSGVLAWLQGDYPSARAHHEASLKVFRTLGEQHGIARALNCLADVARNRGDLAEARARHEESLSIARDLDHRPRIVQALVGLGNVALDQGDYAGAREVNEESLSILRELGDQHGSAVALMNLGICAGARGDHAVARAHHTESLRIRRELGDESGIAAVLLNLGNVALDQGDLATAFEHLTESLAIAREIGSRTTTATALLDLGIVTLEQGNVDVARVQIEESLSMSRELGYRYGMAAALENLGRLEKREGDLSAAVRYFEESLVIQGELAAVGAVTRVLGTLGVLAGQLEEATTAARLLGAADSLRESSEGARDTDVRGEIDDMIAHLQSTLGKDDFGRQWAVGRAMSMEEVIAYALEKSDPDAGR